MIESARIAAPNGLLLVLDPSSGVLPETLGGESIVATSSALAIGTVAEFDGETEVHLGARGDRPEDPSLVLRWEGSLETSGRLGVLTIYNDVLIESAAPTVAQVEVWTNDPVEPDVIWVAMP